MSLFFETSHQARVFLAAIPIGIAMGLLLDLLGRAGRFRVLLDVLCLLMCGVCLILLLILTRDDGLRLYHLLALFVGACIYLLGVGRLISRLCDCRKKTKKMSAE